MATFAVYAWPAREALTGWGAGAAGEAGFDACRILQKIPYWSQIYNL